jgi:hypothetical protein
LRQRMERTSQTHTGSSTVSRYIRRHRIVLYILYK